MQVCEALIGKPEQVARAAGLRAKAAYHWRHANSNRRAGDLPSAWVMRHLLAYSEARQLGLVADHLIWGAPEAEVARILAERQAVAAFSSCRMEAAA